MKWPVATGSQCPCLHSGVGLEAAAGGCTVRQYQDEVNVSHTVSGLLYASLSRCIYRDVHNGRGGGGWCVWGILNSLCLCVPRRREEGEDTTGELSGFCRCPQPLLGESLMTSQRYFGLHLVFFLSDCWRNSDTSPSHLLRRFVMNPRILRLHCSVAEVFLSLIVLVLKLF